MKAQTPLTGKSAHLRDEVSFPRSPLSRPHFSESQLVVMIGQLRSETPFCSRAAFRVRGDSPGHWFLSHSSVYLYQRATLPTQPAGRPNRPHTQRQRASSQEITQQIPTGDQQWQDFCTGSSRKVGTSPEVLKSRVSLQPKEGCILQSRKLIEQWPMPK